jgi:threonine/homoserine/homoserine lactone efflux protein
MERAPKVLDARAHCRTHTEAGGMPSAGSVPQFGTSFAALALLELVFCAMTFLWLACYAMAVAKMGDLLRRSPARRILDAVTGTVLIALGVRLAAEQP